MDPINKGRGLQHQNLCCVIAKENEKNNTRRKEQGSRQNPNVVDRKTTTD